MAQYYVTFARKINEVLEFYIIIARIIFFPIFFWGRGASAPLIPLTYAYTPNRCP